MFISHANAGAAMEDFRMLLCHHYYNDYMYIYIFEMATCAAMCMRLPVEVYVINNWQTSAAGSKSFFIPKLSYHHRHHYHHDHFIYVSIGIT